MFTPEGFPLCDLCGMWTIPSTGYTFTVQKVTPVTRNDGIEVFLRKTVSLAFCSDCHDILHCEDTESLFYRQRVMLQILGRMHMTTAQLTVLRQHCQRLIDDFEGGAFCSHEE